MTNGGINVGGMFHVSNEVVMYGIAGIIGLGVIKSTLDRKESGYTRTNMSSYMARSYVASSTESILERIAQRLVAISTNGAALRARVGALRAAIARYRNQLAAAVAAYIVKRQAYKNKTITLEEFKAAVAAFRTTVRSILDQLRLEFEVPIQSGLTSI